MRQIILVDLTPVTSDQGANPEWSVVEDFLNRFGDSARYLPQSAGYSAGAVQENITYKMGLEPLLAVVIILGDWPVASAIEFAGMAKGQGWPVRVFSADPAKADMLRAVDVWATESYRTLIAAGPGFSER